MVLNIGVYQMSAKVGDIEGNMNKIIEFYNDNSILDVLLTPECALSGYGSLDDLFSPDFQGAIDKAIKSICAETVGKNATLVLGTPYFENKIIYNVALVISNGEIVEIVYKQKLPNYGVFNEYRYFSQKETKNVVEIAGHRVGIFVCEDMWHQDVLDSLMSESPDVLLSINASPFELNKTSKRWVEVQKVFASSQERFQKNIPLIYLNLVGGQDEVVFDGASFALNEYGDLDKLIVRPSDKAIFLEQMQDDKRYFVLENNRLREGKSKDSFGLDLEVNLVPKLWNASREEKLYSCLVRGTRDFVAQNGFQGVILGLSGGIDSALTAAIAVDSLGSSNVRVVSMPSRYTSKLSKKIVAEIVTNLGIKYHEVAIDGILKSYKGDLKGMLKFSKNGVEENLQARIRANILLGFTNQYKDLMLLTTGNKSELATGYSTIYGDSCGAFNIIKDLYKRDVFALSKWRNSNIVAGSLFKKLNVLPPEVIERKPSAELKDKQFDEDSLMDYSILDNILYNIIEENKSLGDLYGIFGEEPVDRVVSLLKNSQYKRHQSAMGIKVSSRSLGREFQYPLSNKFKINNK